MGYNLVYLAPVIGSKFSVGDTITFQFTAGGGYPTIYCDTTADPTTVIHSWGMVSNGTYSWPWVVGAAGSYNWQILGSLLNNAGIWSFTVYAIAPKATNPTPANNSTDRLLDQQLSFTRPSGAVSADVWLKAGSGSWNKIASKVTATTINPGTLTVSTAYQWRVDTYNGADRLTTGDTWNFTTTSPPDAVSTPTPANGATGVARNQDISWAAAARATSYRVYFSTVQADVTNKASAALQVPDITALSWDTGLMGINVTYYWRIVSINSVGSTDGPVWTFVTGTPVVSDPVVRNYKRRLVALANNKLWYGDDSVPTGMASLTVNPGGSYALDTTKPCAMLEAFQKVYIINDSKYFVVDFCNIKLVSQTVFNYTTNYVPERGSLLYQGSACMVVDFVDSPNKAIYGFVTNGTFVNNAAVTGNDSMARPTSFTTAVSGGVVAPNPPHVYKWTPYPNRLSATGNEYGIMPVHSTILRMYRGRPVLAGDKTAPHQWYMGEQGNFYNWAYGSSDQKAPVAGTDTDIGKIGDIIRAVIPYSDDYCIFGCSGSLWLLRGDPAVSASLDSASYVVGIFSDTSWCFDDVGNLYVLNPNGIYALSQGMGAPQSLTDKIIPNFSADFPVDDSIHQICMAYDKIRNGILITKTSDTDNLNYWLDLRNGGFFPEIYPNAIATTAIYYFDSMVASYRTLHLGGKDGYIRAFDDTAKSDDLVSSLTPISAEMVIGPLPMSKTGSQEGIMLRLNVTPARGTDQVKYQIFTGDTAEEIIQAVEAALPTARISGMIGTALRVSRPRARGAYFALRFYSDGAATHVWALDNLSGEFISLGMVP